MSDMGFATGALEGGFDNFVNAENLDLDQMPTGIPKPMYWRLLLYPYIPPKETRGGILLPDSAGDAQEYFAFMARVIDVGPKAFQSRRLRVLSEAGTKTMIENANDGHLDVVTERTRYHDQYADEALIPGPGDWVIFQRHAGLRIEYRGLKFFMCDDDAILALIDSPEGYKAYV